MISGNSLNQVACMHQGFCSIPINPFEKNESGDFMLKLLEIYLIHMQYEKDTQTKNQNDFGALIQINQSNHSEDHKSEGKLKNY